MGQPLLRTATAPITTSSDKEPMMTDAENGADQPNNTLLLDLAQSLGRIEGQNQLILHEQARAADSRKEQYQALDQIRSDAHEVKIKMEAIAMRVTDMEPDVKKMKAFRAQAALAVVYVTAAVTGAFNLIWYGITHMNEIKTAMREFLK